MANLTSVTIIVKIEKSKKEQLEKLIENREIYDRDEAETKNYIYRVLKATQRWRMDEEAFEFLLPIAEEIIICSEENGESLYEKVESYDSEDENGNEVKYFGEKEIFDSVIEMWESVIGIDKTINEIANNEMLWEIEYKFENECMNNDIQEVGQLFNHMENTEKDERDNDFFYTLLIKRNNDFNHCLETNFKEEDLDGFGGLMEPIEIFEELLEE